MVFSVLKLLFIVVSHRRTTLIEYHSAGLELFYTTVKVIAWP